MGDGLVSRPSLFTVACLIIGCAEGEREEEEEGERRPSIAFDGSEDDGKTSRFVGVATGNGDVGLVMSADGENKRRKNEPNLAIRETFAMLFRLVSSERNANSSLQRRLSPVESTRNNKNDNQ